MVKTSAPAPARNSAQPEGAKPTRRNREPVAEPPKFETRDGRYEVAQQRRSAEGSQRASRPRVA